MPLKIIHPDHTEIMGVGVVLLFSPHTPAVGRDLYTGPIVEEAALLSKSWAIIAKQSRPLQSGDETQSAMLELDRGVQNFVEEYGIRCVISVGGTVEPGIILLSPADRSEWAEILDIIRSGLEPHFTINSVADQSEDKLLRVRSEGVSRDELTSHSIYRIRLELGPEERGFHKDQIVNSLADVVGLINAKLGFSEDSGSALH
ncbi:MAG TPA: hypothetical protein VNA15_06145 [Candidatus Angelobacter sp.]|nr:hypothetical protein [Candidatus Angelobacter sp.]